MKRPLIALCCAPVLMFSLAAVPLSPVIAADAAPPPPKQPVVIEVIAIGTLGEVDLANSAFVLKLADGKTVNVTFTEQTKITLNGEASDKAAIRAGERAIVNHTNGVASLIEVRGG